MKDMKAVVGIFRSREKAEQQFRGLPVDVATGDMTDVAAFAEALRGIDLVFHTAAYFRDS